VTPWQGIDRLALAVIVAGFAIAVCVAMSDGSQVGRYAPVIVPYDVESSPYGPARKGARVYIYDTTTGQRVEN